MTNALEISNLTKIYDVRHKALDRVTFNVAEGDFFGLLGANGAGKSTTIGVLSHLVNKTSGKVSIFGLDIDKDMARAKRQIGVVPQEFNFDQFDKPFNILKTQAGLYGIDSKRAEERTEYYLKKLSLWGRRFATARSLSGGMKRRMMIARSLVHQPKLLILDEPTAGVDIEIRRTMWDFLKEINEKHGITIILTTHYLEEAEQLCRHIAIIDRGRIVENGSTKSLLRKLNTEIFLFDCAKPIEEIPDIAGYELKKVENKTLCVTMPSGKSLTELFASLQVHKIEVLSMRNRTNRLEELLLQKISPEA